ncbi:MAG TPA: DUF917 domain-containing protein, partial [Cellulomonas sp.]
MTTTRTAADLRAVTAAELEAIARGAALLGTGGGGDPYVGRLLAEHALGPGGSVPVVPLHELPDDAVVAAVGIIGAPTIGVEKIQGANETIDAIAALNSALPRPVTHLVCTEIGGSNSMVPIVAAARTGLPLVDADGMGRALPELQMLTPGLHGHAATPLGLSDEKGNRLVLHATDNLWAERLARSAAVTMGCSACYAMYPLSGAEARAAYIPGTLSWAYRLGLLMAEARRRHEDVAAVLADELGGAVLFRGKVVDVDRRTEGGFVVGTGRLDGVDGWAGSGFTLRFQNEHLVAERDDEVLVTTPDLVCVLDADVAAPVTTEALRYGMRVSV